MCSITLSFGFTCHVAQVKMCEKGYTYFTVDHTISKVMKLKHKHKTECDKKRRSGRNRAKPWKFFKSLHRILGTCANIQPPFLLDSSSVSVEEQLLESDGVEGTVWCSHTY